MLPTQDQIKLAAFNRWQRRGGGDGFDQADWFGAERDLVLSLNYHVAALYLLDDTPKRYLGRSTPRWCRFCGRTPPQATFRSRAHAIPEFLGNKSLLSHDECDQCNKFFSETIEDSFGKLLLPLRTSLAIAGKTGVPVYKAANKESRIEYDRQERKFNVKETAGTQVFEVDHDRKQLKASLVTQPFVPVAVFKCLTKMALAIMPDAELPGFEGARQWVLDPDHSRNRGWFKGAGCYLYFLRLPYPRAWTALLRLFTTDTPLPYMLYLVGTANLLFQSPVPFAKADWWLNGQRFTVPRVGSAVIPDGWETTCQVLPLSSAELVQDTLDLEIGFESSYVEEKGDAKLVPPQG